MSTPVGPTDGPVPGPVLVWDLPTRVLHWTLVGSFLGGLGVAAIPDDKSPAFRLHMLLGLMASGGVVLRLCWGLAGSGSGAVPPLGRRGLVQECARPRGAGPKARIVLSPLALGRVIEMCEPDSSMNTSIAGITEAMAGRYARRLASTLDRWGGEQTTVCCFVCARAGSRRGPRSLG
jgi:hypothetical protein